MANKLKQAFQLNRDAAIALAKRKAAEAAKPKEDDTAEKPHFKQYQFKNKVKTDTHRIVHGMTVTFKDGRKVKYSLGDVDTILLKTKNRDAYHGQLLYKTFISCIYRSGLKHKVNNPEEDIVFDYTDVERAKGVGLSGAYDRKRKDS